MTSSALRLSALAGLVLLLLAACAKAPEAPPPAPAPPPAAKTNLVAGAERSPHFEDVSQHLELGGVLYGFVDVDGDALALARQTQAAAKTAVTFNPQLSMFAKQDFKELFTMMGFDDIKAIGVSSVRESGGLYRNRTFLYTPAGRQGLLAVFGGAPAAFTTVRMAPADADFFCEHEVDLKAVYDTVEAVVAKVNGPEAATSFRDQARRAGAAAGISLLDLLQGLKGRVTFFSQLQADRTVPLPGVANVVLPGVRFVLRIEHAGPALRPLVKVASTGEIAAREGTATVYPLHGGGDQPGQPAVVAFEGSTFYAASSQAFLTECLERSSGGLDTVPAFKADLADLGPTGNGLTWMTPTLFESLRTLAARNPNAPPPFRNLLDLLAISIPESSAPLLSVRTNLPDGILIRSHWNRSLKADLALITIYNPVSLGLLSAMAIPAIQKVRANSQSVGVVKNLTALHNAAEAYCIAHQVDECTYDQIVGPGLLVPEITPLAGEDYRTLTYRKGWALAIRLPDGRRFIYPPSGLPYVRPPLPAGTSLKENRPTPGRRPAPAPTPPAASSEFGLNPADQGVYENLRILHDAAEKYYAQTGTAFVTYEQLVGPGKLVPLLELVHGENYRTLLFKQGRPLRLHLPDGREVVYPAPDEEK